MPVRFLAVLICMAAYHFDVQKTVISGSHLNAEGLDKPAFTILFADALPYVISLM
jgi:hypothetical protein